MLYWVQNNEWSKRARVAGVETTLASSHPGIASIQGHLQSVEPRTAPAPSVLYWVAEHDVVKRLRAWLGSKRLWPFSSWDCRIEDTFDRLDQDAPDQCFYWVAEPTTWSKRLRAWLGRNDFWPVLFLGLPASKDTFDS